MRPMRTMAVATAMVIGVAAGASAQTAFDGFGSLSFNQLSSTATGGGFPVDFGGGVTFELLPSIELRGEFGQLGNVLPNVVAIPLSFAPTTLRVSAFYGEGGIRFVGAHESHFNPYVEGTVGMAHLRFNVDGLSASTDALVRAALNLVDTRDPIVGLGGGILLRGSLLQVDLGYRYKRILTNNSLVGTLVSAGQNLQTNQLRFGVGVRF